MALWRLGLPVDSIDFLTVAQNVTIAVAADPAHFRTAANRRTTTRKAPSHLAVLLAMVLCGTPAHAQVLCESCGGGGNPSEFLVRSYQGRSRCLDYTPEVLGSPVFINECAAAHPVIVEELNDGKHTVVLHAGTKVIGTQIGLARATGSLTTAPPALDAAEFPLVLQNPIGVLHSPGLVLRVPAQQHFALDGDSIILSASMPEPPTSSPVLVAKVHNARGAIGTPVVLGARKLADNEFWDFVPTNEIDHDPTSGFVRVSTSLELAGALLSATTGTVIKVDPTVSIDVFPSGVPSGNPYGTPITAPGVTIRGDRRGTNLGPELVGPYSQDSDNLLLSLADYTRVTGLRVRGPSRSTDVHLPTPAGIGVGAQSFVCDPPAPDCGYDAPEVYVATIDHNDISDWPGNGIGFSLPTQVNPNCGYPYGAIECHPVCQTLNQAGLIDPRAPRNGYVERNFIHHNERTDLGYGVGVGGKVLIVGNTFLMNRHAIAADGDFQDTYTAWFNLVLSNVPTYKSSSHEQDFDMHGTGPRGYGGIAGSEVDISWNTFLGGDRINFSLRGLACAKDYFHDNVSEQQFVIGDENNDSAIYTFDRDISKVTGGSFPAGFSAPYIADPYPWVLWVFGNQWRDISPSYTDPTAKLRVGDFDGDRVDDLFLATGRAWYFSPGGVAEWRYLSAQTDKVDDLLFGDFDGDGRTDVVAIHAGQLVVSWGGISDWEVLNPNPAPGAITDMAVGDFVGDTRSDIFFADGTSWYVSDGGSSPFSLTATSSFRVPDLRFGDFDGDGKTDVFGVVGDHWNYSASAAAAWTQLPVTLSTNIANLEVADFDGDGFADVALTNSTSWAISYGGATNWSSQSEAVPLSAAAGIGHFLGNPGADVLLWNGYGFPWFVSGICDSNAASDVLCIVSGGGGTPQRQSRQEMR